jgi:hypothetical protein
MKMDRLMTEVDHGARRGYEERAANSKAEGETAKDREAAASHRDA